MYLEIYVDKPCVHKNVDREIVMASLFPKPFPKGPST